MKVTFVDASQVPKKPKPMSPSARETLEIIESLKAGVTKNVWPVEGETVRGLKTSFTRISRTQGIELDLSTSEDGEYIVVKLAG